MRIFVRMQQIIFYSDTVIIEIYMPKGIRYLGNLILSMK